MRWNDWLILTTIGALFGGAFFSVQPFRAIRLNQQGADGAYHDTYYVVANVHYLGLGALFIVLVLTAYVWVIRRATRRIAVSGAIAICVFSLGAALMIRPQAFLPRSGIPRRYLDYAEAFERWQTLSAIGASLAVAALATLLVLTIRAMVLRWHKK